MFINYNISEIISQLSSAIHYDESIVKNLPDGKLNCTHNGRYIKWFLSDGNNISYIHKKDRQLASKLALKKFLLSRIELKIIKGFFPHTSNVTAPISNPNYY